MMLIKSSMEILLPCSKRVKKATAADLEEIRRDMVDQSVLEPASEED